MAYCLSVQIVNGVLRMALGIDCDGGVVGRNGIVSQSLLRTMLGL